LSRITDHLAGGDFGLNGIKEANEFLAAMAFHAATDEPALTFSAATLSTLVA
jgi:hypothetical protein